MELGFDQVYHISKSNLGAIPRTPIGEIFSFKGEGCGIWVFLEHINHTF